MNNEQPPFLLKLSYSNQHAKSGNKSTIPIELTFRDFAAWLFKPVITTDKLNAGFIQRYLAMLRGNEFAGDTADIVIIDCDERIDANGNKVAGASNPMEIHLLLNFLGIDHFIATSHSNDVGKWKYRVYFAATYTREQLPAIIDWFFERTAENGITLVNASENLRWSQIWFKPCCHPDRKHLHQVFWRINGEASNPIDDFKFEPAQPFDVERIYSEFLAKQPQQNTVKKVVAVIDRPKFPIATGGAINATDPIAAFNQAYSVHDILIRNGYKQQGKRYLHPNSSSGIAGTRILETGLAYSDSNDCLNDGKAHDAFDCYRLLECSGDYKAACNWNADIVKANQIAYMKTKEEALPKVDLSAFYANLKMPNTQKPNQLQTDSARCLIESPSARRVETSNSQISIG